MLFSFWLSMANSTGNSKSKSLVCFETISKATVRMIYLRYGFKSGFGLLALTVALTPTTNASILPYLHRTDISGLQKIPRITPIMAPTSFRPQQPPTGSLVDVMLTQPNADEPMVKIWSPSRADIGPITSDSSSLFHCVSDITETHITVEKGRGFRVSAGDMKNMNSAMQILASLEKCFVCCSFPSFHTFC